MNQDVEIEKIYQKKTQLEHILLRPDSYVGSIEKTDTALWILEEGKDKFTYKTIEYVPGLYKIFDEILVNAADNYQKDKSMNTIKVEIDEERNMISIWNNGQGIPIVTHKEYKIFVPELIFGHLLTSSNYDDTQKKVTGGRNGYGAKLTNIFSKRFTVETADMKNKKQFKMTWKDNMSNPGTPSITPFSGSEDYTCISFQPDLKRFGMSNLDKDTVALMRKRVYDLAGVISSKIKVYLNGKKINLSGFSSYADMYLDENAPKIKEKPNDRWEVIVSVSDGQFQQVSFVNSICTSRGGTHVNYLTDQVTEKLIEIIKKKHKDLNVKPFQVKNNIWVFVNALIENPAFDSQTKETLTTKPANYGSNCELSEKFLKDFQKCGIIDIIISQAKAKNDAKLAKALTAGKKSRLLGIPKLEDANDAGTKNADRCTLILTEGDSAKSLAMAGIEIVGRDRFGVFPLRGKLLNVRDATTKQILDNQEIQYVIKILGLQVGKKYDDIKSLRYGSIMIMADQDHDGSHIKGLIVNFIHHFWPSLLQRNGFLKQFITPIIKATKGQVVKNFYTIQDFKRWSEDPNIKLKTWKIKYYKGLGTSTDKEAKEYFQRVDKHQIDFKYEDQEDDKSIELVFSKKNADARKDWLKDYNPDAGISYDVTRIRYKEFVDKELIHFSNSDNVRSIPSICDGLKPGQRKILYACFKRNLKDEIKVAQLSGYVAEHSAYHHGEQSLASTIVGLAQNYVGSNNINLLLPNGQFGTRAAGGKDSASARYIFTNLSKLTRSLFKEHDDHLYRYLEDDGQSVEPEWYLPIIPMCLVNGADGIGTGWSTNVPSYNPQEIVENIKGKLRGEEFKDMNPWYKGFTGEIEKSAKGGYVIKGRYELSEDDPDLIDITELPVHKWTKDYKTYLETMLNPEEGEAEIDDIKEYHSNERVHFVVKMKSGILEKIDRGDGIDKKFKLSTTMSTSNMVLFDHERKLKRYKDVQEILDEFYRVRLAYYGKRKNYLISRLEREIEILSNKMRFIIAVINEDINIRNVKKKALINELLNKKFVPMKRMTKIQSTKLTSEKENKDEEAQEEEDEEGADVPSSEFNYLLQMPLWNLTYEKVEVMKKELAAKEEELEILKGTKIETMWTNDLDEFLQILKQVNAEEEEERLNGKSKGGRRKKIVSAKKNARDELFEESEEEYVAKKPAKKKEKAKDDIMKEDKPKAAAKPKVERSNTVGASTTTGSTQAEVSQSSKESNALKEKKLNTQSSLPNNSILKYIKSSSGPAPSDGENSLSQRLLMREKKGDIQVFSQTYQDFKTKGTQSPTNPKKRKNEDDAQPTSTQKKKKLMIESDDENENYSPTPAKSTSTVAQQKPTPSMFDNPPFADNKDSVLKERKPKKLMLSDDEDDYIDNYTQLSNYFNK